VAIHDDATPSRAVSPMGMAFSWLLRTRGSAWERVGRSLAASLVMVKAGRPVGSSVADSDATRDDVDFVKVYGGPDSHEPQRLGPIELWRPEPETWAY
jgi:hypothetical protein